MNRERKELILRSIIRSSTLEASLFKGCCIAFCGISLLFAAYYGLLPLEKEWSLGCMWIGGFLIAFGLIPYKKLSSMELKPYLIYVDNKELILILQERCLLKLPLESIKKVFHIESKGISGMAITLKSSIPLPAKIPKEVTKATKKIFTKEETLNSHYQTFVIPYFGKNSATEFSNHLVSIGRVDR